MSEITQEGLEMFGQIVAANVADAAATTNLLLEVKDAEILRLAKVIVEIGDIVDRATVIDRKTERALSRHYVNFDTAQGILDRARDSL